MNVLYVCADRGIPLDGYKGAAVHVRQTLGGLARAGCRLTVLAARPGSHALEGCSVIGPSGAADPSRASSGLVEELRGLALSRDLAGAALAAGTRPDVVYERYSLWSVTGAAIAEACGAPLVVEVNAPLVEEEQRYRRLTLAGVAAEIERFVLSRAAAVLCVSSELVRRARRLRGTDTGVHESPNAVDTGVFTSPRQRATNGAPRIVFVGSLKPWHGLPFLVHALARLRERGVGARLCLVGDGPEREGLEALCASLDLGAWVDFRGAVPHEDVPRLLREADIAVAPYPPIEGFYFSPLKVAEYLAAGLPLVASRCGDLPQLLSDGQSALLVPPGDVPALAEALERLVTEPGLRRRLGEAGRRLAVERLSLDAAMARLTGLMSALAAAPDARGGGAP